MLLEVFKMKEYTYFCKKMNNEIITRLYIKKVATDTVIYIIVEILLKLKLLNCVLKEGKI